MAASADSIRADVWLWAARFFRTRSLAHGAIAGGKVAVNGAHCKPARPMRVGDVVGITRDRDRIEVEVLAVSTRRGAAPEAQALYRETAASLAARQAATVAADLGQRVAPPGRPNKAARRRLRALKLQN